MAGKRNRTDGPMDKVKRKKTMKQEWKTILKKYKIYEKVQNKSNSFKKKKKDDCKKHLEKLLYLYIFFMLNKIV